MSKPYHKNHKVPRMTQPFSVELFLTGILQDLRRDLADAYEPLAISMVTGPSAFRECVEGLLMREAVAYASIRKAAALRQVAACVSKLPSWGASSDKERQKRTMQAFAASERKCARTNRRLAFYMAHPMRIPPLLREVFNTAQHEIQMCLGGPPDFEMFSNADFGPGTTYGLPFDNRDIFYKINGDQDVTPRARQLALEVITKFFPRWGEHLAEHGFNLLSTPGNRISSVPKNAKVNRTIGIEPSLNVWLQKAVDTEMKRKLRQMAIYLRDQAHSSALIKREANRLDQVATLDLAAASDTISRKLVEWMLPPEWYDLLDVLRSSCYTLDRGIHWHVYHKFSSMGNATTFPIESLIFGAIARACCRICGYETSRVRVYGDDVIVPPGAALLVIEAFKFAGFNINTEKSFVHGPFRETCGTDLLYGVNVRPVYLRAVPTEPDEVANLFNRLLTNEFGFCFSNTLVYLHSLVHKPLYGPAFFGWTSTERIEEHGWDEWYEGRNTLRDAYFFAPDCSLPSEWSLAYQSDRRKLQFWYRPRPLVRQEFVETLRYAAFLYGVEEGRPKQRNSKLVVRTQAYYGPWPQLTWWPDCYGAVVPTTRRVTLL